MLKYVLAAIILISITSFAACPDYDLSDSPGFKDRKHIQQTDVGWCFGYSNADIISQKLGKAVSPADISIRYFDFIGIKNFKDADELPGGNSYKLKKMHLQDKKFCLESNYGPIPSNLSLFLTENRTNYNQIHQGKPIWQCGQTSAFFRSIADVESTVTHTALENSDSVFKFLKKLNNENCKESITAKLDFDIQEHRTSWSNKKAHEKSKEYLIEQLKAGRMISANVDLANFFKLDLGFFAMFKSRTTGSHAITVTGMAEKNGQCYFKIRDSRFASVNSCVETRLTPQIECLTANDYEVPEDIFLKSLIMTTVVK